MNHIIGGCLVFVIWRPPGGPPSHFMQRKSEDMMSIVAES